MKNQRGVTLTKLVLILGAIILFFIIISGGDNNSSDDGRVSSKRKESRASYIPKCTTIDYKSLARNPNSYIGRNYTFTGEVIQVLNGPNNKIDLRVNVTPKRYEYLNETYYEDTMYVTYQYSSSTESRILEDDIITLYGSFAGIYSYESVMGAQISIPLINALYIDIRN